MKRPAVPYVVLAAMVAIVSASFTWPSGSLAPRDLPVGVVDAAPPALADAGAFEVHRYSSHAQARAAVRDREVYGALSGRALYVATGAGPAVAGALRARRSSTVANPWSGIGSAPELLPEPAGAIGQLLPTGAGGNLLRSVAFFDGGGAGEHLAVLAVWAVAGLALLAAAALRSQRGALALRPTAPSARA